LIIIAYLIKYIILSKINKKFNLNTKENINKASVYSLYLKISQIRY